MNNSVLLLSIRPEHAHKIFNGEKVFELRRVRPKVMPGDLVLVYVTCPVSALWGTFMAGPIMEGAPSLLWKQIGADTGLSRSALLNYFDGLSVGYAIPVNDPQLLKRHIGLSEMSACWPGFRPPQSFRYLTQKEIQKVRRYADSARRLRNGKKRRE